jgi:hypothetical protein
VRVIDIRGTQSGLLTAVKPSHKEPRKGTYWVCRCSGPNCGGKGTRKVLAKDFRQKKIRRCLKCVDQVKRATQVVNSAKRWSKKVTGPMYSDEFRKSCKERIAAFTNEQRVLFDVLLDGRTNREYQVQAADIVLRSKDIMSDLVNLIGDNPERWKRYLERQRFKQHSPTALQRAA